MDMLKREAMLFWMRKRWVVWPVVLGTSWIVLHTAVCAVIGVRDDVGAADVIVVFGNKVNEDGTLSARLKARLDRAEQLYESGTAPRIFVSGGLGHEGHEEADVMQQYLIERGVPTSAVVVDRTGYSTYETARNASRFMESNRWTTALLVTHYYHVARARMAFHSFGVNRIHHSCARMGPEIREPLALLREFLAFYYYTLRKYE